MINQLKKLLEKRVTKKSVVLAAEIIGHNTQWGGKDNDGNFLPTQVIVVKELSYGPASLGKTMFPQIVGTYRDLLESFIKQLEQLEQKKQLMFIVEIDGSEIIRLYYFDSCMSFLSGRGHEKGEVITIREILV